jgi:hypothetical protein
MVYVHNDRLYILGNGNVPNRYEGIRLKTVSGKKGLRMTEYKIKSQESGYTMTDYFCENGSGKKFQIRVCENRIYVFEGWAAKTNT